MATSEAQKRANAKWAEKNKDKIREYARTQAKKKYNEDKENTKKSNLKGYIYKVVNRITNEIYIGSTELSLIQRFRRHKACSNKNSKLYKNMKLHGKDNFYIELIEEIYKDNDKCLKEIEAEYIIKFDTINNGLNCNLPNGKISFEDKKNYHKEYMRQYLLTPKGQELKKKNNELNKIRYHLNKINISPSENLELSPTEKFDISSQTENFDIPSL